MFDLDIHPPSLFDPRIRTGSLAARLACAAVKNKNVAFSHLSSVLWPPRAVVYQESMLFVLNSQGEEP
jgi:hypothetical protein